MTAAAPSKWLTMLAVCLGLGMLVIDLFIVIVALPAISRDLKADLSTVEWIISAYALALGVLPLAMGRLGDILGRRKIYFCGLGIFIAASLACGAAQDIYQLIAFRVLQGTGAAIMQPATLAIATGAFPAHQRGLAIGIWGGISGFGLIAGPVLGGLLVRGDDWRWIFLINGPIGVAAVLMALLFVPESRDESAPRAVDWPGLMLLSGALTLLVFGVTRANAAGWMSPVVLGCLAASVVTLFAFLAVERRTLYPLVDFALFRNPALVAACLNTFLFTGAVFGSMPYLSLFMQNYWGMSALESGLAFLPATGVAVLTTPLGGLIGQRLGTRLNLLMTSASVAMVVGALFLLRLDTRSTYTDGLLPALLILGAAVGMLMSTSGFAVMSAAPSAKRGLAAGTWTMARNVGPAIGIAILGTVFLGHVDTEIPRQLSDLPPVQVAEITAAADRFLTLGPPGAREAVSEIIVQGLTRIALAISILCGLAALAAVFIRHRPVSEEAEDLTAETVREREAAAEWGVAPLHGAESRPATERAALYDAEGRRVALWEEMLTCGRVSRNDLVLNHQEVSRSHARFERGLSGYLVTDLGSANGTYLNDELLTPQQGRLLKDGDRLTIGPYTLTFRREAPGSRSAQGDGGRTPSHAGVSGLSAETTAERAALYDSDGRRVAEWEDALTCGRGRDNALILNHEDVSRSHARFERGLSGYLVTDLGSANGTYLNDELLTPQQGRLLKDGDRLTIGPYTLTFRREAPGSRSAQGDGSSDVQRASR